MFTAGEAGTIGVSKTLPRGELARLRRAELGASCVALGVRDHRILGAPDGGVAGVDEKWAVAEILADIEKWKPQVAVTFHRRGVSGHPDHIAVTTFLDRALLEAGDDGPLVCYEWGIPRPKARLYERPNLAPLEEDEIAAIIEIDDRAMSRKIEAIRRHETQVEFFKSLEQKFDYRKVSTPECFARGRSRVAFDGKPVDDLFQGIEVG
jgi:LmbE family N-acetylglucosaminyl deacetylase